MASDNKNLDDPLLGAVIESYKIIELIGSGGMGRVYKAQHQVMHRFAAIKILSSEWTKQPESLKRFINEAKAAARISHVNVAAISGCGLNQELGVAYIIMEYLDGQSLSKHLEKEHKFNIERSIHIFTQICEGLSEAHRRSVVHRDMKPSNVILLNDSREKDFVKVIDFGIAKVSSEQGSTILETLTNTGTLMGSPYYMSPEQFKYEKITNKSDIYSLGCLMYETLSGTPPFNVKNPVALMTMHTTELPPSLVVYDADPTVLHRLDQIIYKCLKKDPDERYSTIDELRSDLESLGDTVQKLSAEKRRVAVGSGVASFKIALTKVQRALLGKLGISSSKDSKFRVLALSGIGTLVAFLAVFVLTAYLCLSAYIPESDARMLKEEVGIQPLVYRQTNPPEVPLSTLARLSLQSDEKLMRQYAKATNFRSNGNLNAAIIEYQDAMNSAVGAGLAQDEIGAEIMSESALCYLFVGNLPLARQYSEKALHILEDLGDYNHIRSLLASLVRARTLLLMKDDKAAKEEFQHMQATLRGQDVKNRFDQIAYSESFLADFLRQNKELDRAVAYYQAAEQHWAGFQADGAYNQAAILDQLGMLWTSAGKQDLAKDSFEKAISALQSSSDKTKLAQAKLAYHLSQIKWAQHDFASAVMENMEAKQLLKQ